MMYKMTNEEYQQYAALKSPPSPLAKDVVKAFIAGGIICAAAQVITELLGSRISDTKLVSSLTSVTMIFFGVLLTALGLYDKLAKFGGAGTLVPITGFANSIASPAIEFKTEGLVSGMGAKMFVIAGPVLVFGITASVVYGLVYYLMK
ncbi:MAG: SpoVA/SpoVAEb family sporulation membrane protein [Oscillospiraceae bacterium]|jgi:stage V sporulation protein AC|nr:SpoVA/SpoVAEb family sporulation membrane protein [Oscillospiraceae bacterium]